MVDNTDSYNGKPSLTNSKHYSHNSHRDTPAHRFHADIHADREGCCSFPQPGMQALIGDWKHLEGDNQWKRKRERQTHKHTHITAVLQQVYHTQNAQQSKHLPWWWR